MPFINTLRPRQNGRHFADGIFKCIFLNENVWILIKNLLRFVHKGPINNIPTFVQIMAWRRSGDKPLSESMLVSLPTHICITRPQWVKYNKYVHIYDCHAYGTQTTCSTESIWKCEEFLSTISSPPQWTQSPPSVTYMCQWTGSAVVQIMACMSIGRQAII